jgi:hypothetical protein
MNPVDIIEREITKLGEKKEIAMRSYNRAHNQTSRDTSWRIVTKLTSEIKGMTFALDCIKSA